MRTSSHDYTGAGLWRQLFDPWSDNTRFPAVFVNAVREYFAGMSPVEFDADMEASDMTALQGAFSTVCESFLGPTDSQSFWRALSVTRSLGSGRPMGFRTFRGDIWRDPLALLQRVDVVPTVVLRLDAALFDRDACQRPEAFLRFLSDLAGVRRPRGRLSSGQGETMASIPGVWIRAWEDALHALCADIHPIDPAMDATERRVPPDDDDGDDRGGGGVRVATFGYTPAQQSLPGAT